MTRRARRYPRLLRALHRIALVITSLMLTCLAFTEMACDPLVRPPIDLASVNSRSRCNASTRPLEDVDVLREDLGTAVTCLAFKDFEELRPTGTDLASPTGRNTLRNPVPVVSVGLDFDGAVRLAA